MVGAVGKWATGGLSSLDGKTLGKASGMLVFALLGGAMFGGIGLLAGMALAQYFASKGASSRDESVLFQVRRAVLLAEGKDTKQADTEAWANHVMGQVQSGFDNLGDMDPKELAAILKAAHEFEDELIPKKRK
jgi:hypothetical protein